ncbi:hypothetical protein KL932_004078 [Ogataea haglerorum]|nr:hypothetical protein KL932_004078 [Ogataea haglerorum]
MLLAERVRRAEEKEVVKTAIENVMRVKLDMDGYYAQLEQQELAPLLRRPGPVVWTKAMRRLAVLVAMSIKHKEPLLLVGETGCGKTTVCQLVAEFYGKELIVVNAHQNTETGDLLGSQRPVRNRQKLKDNLEAGLRGVLAAHGATYDGLESAMGVYNDLRRQGALSDEETKTVEQLLAATQPAACGKGQRGCRRGGPRKLPVPRHDEPGRRLRQERAVASAAEQVYGDLGAVDGEFRRRAPDRGDAARAGK